MFKKIVPILTIAVMFLASVGIGGELAKAAGSRYDVTPTYSDSSGLYSIEYLLRGDTYHAINVEKYGDAENNIAAKYWVGHNYSSNEQFGVQMMYDPNKMTLSGFYEPTEGGYGQKMDVVIDSTSDGLRWIRAQAYVEPDNYGLVGFDFQLDQYAQKFEYTALENVVRHNFAGTSVDYTLCWGCDLTRVNGFYVYQY
jgi:hypothetical protein